MKKEYQNDPAWNRIKNRIENRVNALKYLIGNEVCNKATININSQTRNKIFEQAYSQIEHQVFYKICRPSRNQIRQHLNDDLL